MTKTFTNSANGITTKIDAQNQILEQYQKYSISGDFHFKYDVRIDFTPDNFDYKEVKAFLKAAEKYEGIY